MNKIKKYEMPMLISIFLLVFIALISVSYAYFKARINNIESASTIAFTSGEMTINYENNSAVLTGTNIIPGWSTTKKFTLKGKNDSKPTDTQPDNNMYYKIGIAVDINTFTQDAITYKLEKDSTSSTNGKMADATYGIVPQTGTKYIGKGYFATTSTYVNHIYKLTISFPDNGENQSYDNDKKFAAHVVIEKSTSSEDINVTITPKITDYITKLYNMDASDNGLEQDDTIDKNIRYVGASPKNYLNFNNETWRIIGVFNDITTIDEQGNEKKESLVKIVRDKSLGTYSWDSSSSSVNNGFGVNEWSQANLMTELNTDYIDTSKASGTTNWDNGQGNAKTKPYDYSNNIKSGEIDKIAKASWNTNRNKTGSGALDSYNQERSTNLISTPSDNVPRTNTWDGKVALIYSSDYGYASTNESCRDNMNSKTNDIYNCTNDNWLYKEDSYYYWTLSPYSGDSAGVFHVNGVGSVSYGHAYGTGGVFPAVFLKSDILITSGTGEKSNSYRLG